MRVQLSSLLRLFVILAGALALSSCMAAVFIRVPRHVAFDESKFVAYGGAGSGSVSGQLIVTSDGETHAGDGTTLTLIPITDYTQEMVDRELGHGAPLFPPDSRFRKYVRRARSDSNGNFAFEHVPPGRYFVVGVVEWTGHSDPDALEWQWGCERITVGKGQAVRVRVSSDPTSPQTVIYPSNSWSAD